MAQLKNLIATVKVIGMPASKQQSPRFLRNISDDYHFKTLRQKVNKVLKSLPESRLRLSRIKALVLPCVYFGLYFIALYQKQFIFFCAVYVLLGLTVIIMFLNLIHDLIH